MSRDRERPDGDDRDGASPGGDDRDAASPGGDPRSIERSAALLTAYVDGIAELPLAERRAVEAWLADEPAARAEAVAVQGLLGRLRELPPSAAAGDEPDWAEMERSIRQAVADLPARPWWRRWPWLVPAMTCATAAAVLLVVWPRAGAVSVTGPDERRAPIPGLPRAVQEPAPAAPAGDADFALWLDGRVVDVDLAAAALPEVPRAAEDLLGDADPGAAPNGPLDEPDEVGLLPAADLAWVDALDDAALDRAERWLADPAATAKRGSPADPIRPQRKKS